MAERVDTGGAVPAGSDAATGRAWPAPRPQRRRILLILEARAYGRGVLAGVAAYVEAGAGWDLHVEDWAGAHRPILPLADCDGVIALVRSRELLEQVGASGLPAVNVSSGFDVGELATVCADDHAVGTAAAAHLRVRGYRRFAFAGDPARRYGRDREAAFIAALRAHDPHAPVAIAHRPPPPAALADWIDDLAAWLRPRAGGLGVFAANDCLAVQIAQACRRAGLRVPEDVGIVGVDNDEAYCRLHRPELSSIPHDGAAIGRTAAVWLDGLLRGRRAASGRIVVPPLPVVARASTDALAAIDPHIAAAARFIREQVGRGITVADVVAAVPLSRSALERGFARCFGHAPGSEIRRRRLELAQRLLAETAAPIRQVAARAGFRSARQLSASFQTACGMSPSQFRRRRGAAAG